MPYELNPHRHVKIWLSKNPNVFLNFENQLRLIRMRAKNPDDTIHMVYAKNLLSEKALNALTDFCKKHTIISVAIEDEVLPRCVENEHERNLAALYEREIDSLNAGGSVAAASNILRWLSPIYSLGVYSDFDVTVDTTQLPPTISVDAPILLKLGSIKMPISSIKGFTIELPKDNLEGIVVNNDSLAVVGNDPLAIQTIQKIQQRICNAYLDPEIYTKSIEKLFTDIYLYVYKQVSNRMEGFSAAVRIMEKMAGKNKILLALAGGFGLVNPDPIALRKAILDKTIDTIYFEDGQQLIIQSVVSTSGPEAVLLGLFEHCAVSADRVNEEIKPYSFQHYGLNEAFLSKNSYDFHLMREDYWETLKEKNTEDKIELSWLKESAAVVTGREEKRQQSEGNASGSGQAFFHDSQKQAPSTSESHMSYELNPHRHVKIWLSKNPDVFLNQENQLRLVRMRAKNPDDTIHMVYAKNLLSEKALNALTDFCKKHKIISVAIEDEVLPRCVENEHERNLSALYEREIDSLNAGGNVAAASDILRWLSPVYSLGIYSDFDVVVDTTELPPTIRVDAPILLSLGSRKIPMIGYPKNDLESIIINNNFIAVVGDDPLAVKTIQKIQQRICNAYLDPEIYMESIGKFFTDVYLHVNKQIPEGVDDLVAAIQITGSSKEDLVLLGLASGLGLVNPDPIALRKAILDKTINTVDSGKAYRQELILRSVLYTTGPWTVKIGLFGHSSVSADRVDKEIKPYSFQHYGLNDAFSLDYDFHFTQQAYAARSKGKNFGDICDLSWLEAGAAVVTEREEKMRQAATNLQRRVRGGQGRKIAAEEKRQQSEARSSGRGPALFRDTQRQIPSTPESDTKAKSGSRAK